jgi:hypothetical protein
MFILNCGLDTKPKFCDFNFFLIFEIPQHSAFCFANFCVYVNYFTSFLLLFSYYVLCLDSYLLQMNINFGLFVVLEFGILI